jgi:hypothetical protein
MSTKKTKMPSVKYCDYSHPKLNLTIAADAPEGCPHILDFCKSEQISILEQSSLHYDSLTRKPK